MSDSAPSCPVGGPPPLEIFISHKTKDKEVASKLKSLLESRCSNMTYFLSSDARSIKGGDDWSKNIHDALERAGWLFLLYTTPEDKWDWCVYEAAYFLGRRGAAQTKSLVVLHPPGVLPPAPLRGRQSIAAEPAKLLEFFKDVFQVGNPLCHFGGTDTDLVKIAGEIAEAIAPLKAESFCPNKELTVVVPAASSLAGMGNDDLTDQAYVELNAMTAALFQLLPTNRYPWREFKKAARGFNFDTQTLANVVALARAHRAVPDSLQLFRAQDRCGYRPLVYSVTCQDGGEVRVELVLAALPPTMDPVALNSVDRVHRLFRLGLKFRREVSEKFAQMAQGDQNATDVDKLRFLNAVLHAVDEVGAEAWNDGFRDDARITESFDEDERAELTNLLRDWHTVYSELQNASAGTTPCPRPHDLLTTMRLINLKFMRLSAKRLDELVAEFPHPEAKGLSARYRKWVPKEFLSPSRRDRTRHPGETDEGPPSAAPASDAQSKGSHRKPSATRNRPKKNA